MPVILALDPARHTGYAIGDGKNRVCGVWDLARGADAHPGGQLARFEELLLTAIRDNAVDLVAFEEASFGSHHPNIQAMHNEKAGVIKLVCCKAGVDCRGFSIGTIKKFVTGSGRATKQQMIRAAMTILDLETQSDDVADAAAVLALAQREAAGLVAVEMTPRPVKRRKAKAAELRLF